MLERIFSTLINKVSKVDKRSSFGNDLLDDLLVLNTDRVALKYFNPPDHKGLSTLDAQFSLNVHSIRIGCVHTEYTLA